MGRTKTDSSAEPEITQDEPTQPWPVDSAGRALDQYGLPINGPARAEALAERRGDDPALSDPSATAPALPAVEDQGPGGVGGDASGNQE